MVRKVKARMSERGATMKEVVNDALRCGLAQKPPRRKKEFTVKTFSSKFRPGIDPDHLGRLLDELDVEEFAAKMARDGEP